MSKVAKCDLEFLNKGKAFLKHIQEVDGINYKSISRTINGKNTTKIRDCKVGLNVIERIIKSYYNNYVKWCTINSLEIEERFILYNKELYS